MQLVQIRRLPTRVRGARFVSSETLQSKRVRRAGFQTGAAPKSEASRRSQITTQNRESRIRRGSGPERRHACAFAGVVRRPSNRVFLHGRNNLQPSTSFRASRRAARHFGRATGGAALRRDVGVRSRGEEGRMPACNIPCMSARPCSATSRRVILDSRLARHRADGIRLRDELRERQRSARDRGVRVAAASRHARRAEDT